MRVDVSGYQFIFPPQCVCCGELANTTWAVSASRSRGTRVVHTSTRSWDFPYCSRCVHHASTYKGAGVRAWIVILLFAAIGIALHSDWSVLPLALGLALGIFVHVRTRKQAELERTATCVSAAPAVGYLGFNGTVNSFDIVGQYAWAFASANASKLINETQGMREHIDAIAPQRRTRNVQRPRRFES